MAETVDPTTGQINPQTLQVQADQAAVKANRAGSKPVADPTAPVDATMAPSAPITYKGNFRNSSIDAAAKMFGNVPNPVPNPITKKDPPEKVSKKVDVKENDFKQEYLNQESLEKLNNPKTEKDVDNLVKMNRTLNNHLQGKSKIKIKLPEEKGVGGDPDEDFEWSE